MKKLFKALIVIGGTAFAGYTGAKVYRAAKLARKIEGILPAHLESFCGETPDLRCMVQMRTMIKVSIRITLSPKALAKFDNLTEFVYDFIRENQPGLLRYKLIVEGIEKREEEEQELSYSEPDEG